MTPKYPDDFYSRYDHWLCPLYFFSTSWYTVSFFFHLLFHLVMWCLTSTSHRSVFWVFSSARICKPDFSSLPLHASLDFIMDSRHISRYSLPRGLSDGWIWHKLLLYAQWSHSTHNCIGQISLFLCNFLELFHFSCSYCLLCLISKSPPQQPQKPDPLQPFLLSFVCLLLSLIKGLKYWQFWSFLASK